MEHKYIKNKTFYLDLYDLHTIEECIRIENKKPSTSDLIINNKEITFAEAESCQNLVNNLLLYTYKGNRYKYRQDFINKWMQNDKEKQDVYDNSIEPSVSCKYCDTPLFLISKILEDYSDQPMKVLFMFECPECKKRACYYDDATEKVFEDELCPKCKSEVKYSHKDKSGISITITKCVNCNYKDVDKFDIEKSKRERKERKIREKSLIEKYRRKYCLSEEEGSSFIREMANLESLSRLIKDMDIKETDPVYKYVDKIQKLTVFELEQQLHKILKKSKFVKLSVKEPEIDKSIMVSFTVQDSDSNRTEQESIYELAKLIKKSLKETNWQLMTDGVSYRLGLLSGRLHGYETKEDLYKLAKKLYKSDSSRLNYRL